MPTLPSRLLPTPPRTRLAVVSTRDAGTNQLDDDKTIRVMKITNKLPVPDGRESALLIYPFTFGTGANIPAIEDDVLATRAWTFQERILPPRIAHCTSTQLFWECRQCSKQRAHHE